MLNVVLFETVDMYNRKQWDKISMIPFISMRFWAASVDQNGNEVGSPTDDQYVYIKTINCRHWFDDNAQAHDGVGIRHFTNNGELTPAGQNVVFYRE